MGIPGRSESTISASSGLSVLTRMCTPPVEFPSFRSKRVSEPGATRRSLTVTPVAFNPAVSALLSTRVTGC